MPATSTVARFTRPTRHRRPLAIARLAITHIAVALLLPDVASAQLGGLKKKMEQKAAEMVAGKKPETLPATFLDPRYEITTARFDGLVRGAVRYTDEQARYERSIPERERKAAQAEREMEDLARQQQKATQRIMSSMSAGPAACQIEVAQQMESLPAKDPRRVRAEAMMDRLEKLMDETDKRQRTGQPVDTVGTALRAKALLDSAAISVRGAPCTVTQADVAASQRVAESAMADMKATEAAAARAANAQREAAAVNVERPDRAAIIRQESGLDGLQLGVICDKLIAFIGASNRKTEVVGFTNGERDLLKKREADLRKHGTLMCSGFPE